MKKRFTAGLMLALLGVIALFFINGCAKEHTAAADNTLDKDTSEFKNPILSTGLNPFITQDNGYYYYLNDNNNFINLYRVKQLQFLNNAYTRIIFTPGGSLSQDSLYSANIQTSELHRLNGKWYVYFSADNGMSAKKRIYVLENSSEDPITGDWTLKGKIADTGNDFFATDGTVLEYNNQLYFLWSGQTEANPVDNLNQQLYIAKMSDPLTISGSRALLSAPTQAWEQYQYQDGVNTKTEAIDQAPQVLKNPAGDVFVAFTANSCRSDNMSLGLLSLKKGGDPMKTVDWMKSAGPVFTSNGTDAYGPGHHAFFKSSTGEDWMVYEANQFAGQGCGESRSPRIQKFTWNADGTPNFGTPVLLTQVQTSPIP